MNELKQSIESQLLKQGCRSDEWNAGFNAACRFVLAEIERFTPIELQRYGPRPFKRPSLEDLENAMIESIDDMSKEEIKAELHAAGIDMAPTIAKLHAMVERFKQ